MFIYTIQNKINNKIYVGQTKNFKKRFSEHKYDSRSKNYPLYRSIRKHGIKNFIFMDIEEVEVQDVDDAEIYWIEFFRSWDPNFGYNLTKGGNVNKIITEETRQKMLLHLIPLNKMLGEKRRGIPLSQEVRDKISISHVGHQHTSESKQKMSKTRIERGTFAKENNPNFGKTGELNPSAKLTWKIVENIRKDYLSGIKGKNLMSKYNISETNMYRIIKNKIWKVIL
jgi:hypothetical protein